MSKSNVSMDKSFTNYLENRITEELQELITGSDEYSSISKEKIEKQFSEIKAFLNDRGHFDLMENFKSLDNAVLERELLISRMMYLQGLKDAIYLLQILGLCGGVK
jgi:hypothetical protein